MKKLVCLLVGSAVLGGLWSCTNSDTIQISGHIDNPGNIKVVAFYEGDRKLDSVFMGDGNKFKFERQASQPRLLSLAVGSNRYPVILSPGEPITFITDLQQPERYSVEGSELSQALQDFAPLKQRNDFVQDSLKGVFTKATINKSVEEVESLRGEFLGKFRNELSNYTQEAVAFAKKNKNLAGFYAISTLDPDVAESEIIAYAEEIKDDFTDNRYVSQFKEEAKKLKVLAIGQPAPGFESFTPNNKSVSLSDFKGKYTLIDFWASWCAPCRQENPNIVKQYQVFKDKNFTVLGVSLDNNPGSWLRAIQDDKLEWTQVSDLQAWSSELVGMYRIKSIPTSYLIDPHGIIIAKNLRGKAFEEFLNKTLN